MTAEYAKRRARLEPVVEMTQIKGDSEAHPFLSPNDEFAGFGVAGWEISNLLGSEPKNSGMFAGEYVREALKRGLLLEAQMGVNPYKFGRFMPGTGIPILSEADVLAMEPDYLLVLPWHFRETFMVTLEPFLSRGGRLIFPLPDIEIVGY